MSKEEPSIRQQMKNAIFDFVVSLLVFPLVFVLVVVFAAYRKIIDIILRQSWGENYGGLLDPSDALYIKNEVSKYTITVAMITKSKKKIDLLALLRQRIKDRVFRYPDHYVKVTGTHDVFGGYPYMIKNQCPIEECIRPMDIPEEEEFDEDCLKKLIAKQSNAPFPKNDTALWDFVVSQKPLKSSDGYYRYPAVGRCNHAVGDGTAIFALNVMIFGDESENYSIKLFEKLFNKEPKEKTYFELVKFYLNSIIQKITIFLFLIFMGTGRCLRIFHLREHDKNALHGPSHCGEKIAAWSTDPKKELIKIIKSIKNRVPDAKFSHVISAAISATLTSFYQRNSLPVPNFVTGLLTALVNFPTIDYSKPIKMDNKVSLALMEIPLNQSGSLLQTLQEVGVSTKKINLFDVLLAYHIMTKIVGLFPVQVNSLFFGRDVCTLLITNVPGGGQLKVANDVVVESLMPYAPNVRNVGISFAILTYNDKCEVGLLADKAIMSSEEELQKISDDMAYYIKLLDAESKKVYGDK